MFETLRIALHVHVELHLSHSHCLPLSFGFESVTTPPHSASTRSTRFNVSFTHALLPCSSLLYRAASSGLCVAEIEVYHGIRQDCEVTQIETHGMTYMCLYIYKYKNIFKKYRGM